MLRRSPSAEKAVEVLVVDDNPTDVRLIEKFLSRSRRVAFSVRSAGLLEEALEELETQAIDAILLDLSLADSRDALDGLRRLSDLDRDAAVIIFTARDDESLALEAVRAGAQDYLVKDHVQPVDLAHAILHGIERKRAQRVLEQSEERLTLAVRGASDGLWDWDLVDDSIYFSRRWKELLGLPTSQRFERPDDWFDRIHPEDRASVLEAIEAHRAGETAQLMVEQRMRTASGEFLWTLLRGLAVRDEQGTIYRIAGSMTDITSRKLNEQRLLHNAMHDALTGLPNWALLKDRLSLVLAQARREKTFRFAVLFLDLDRFKNINDSLGHAVGDRLLIGLSKLFKTLVRPGDTVARLGGDEFVLLLHGIEESRDATRVAKRILEELARPLKFDTNELFVGASIGIALGSEEYQEADELLRDADTAMYRAKSTGAGGYVIFDREMHERAQQVQQLEVDLRRAVENDEFGVDYQPVFDLETLEIRGFEALARWQHPERGQMLPEQFISIAEDTGLIVPIGWRVLEQACRQMGAWHRRYPSMRGVSVSVNLSSRQLLHPDLVERLRLALVRSGLDPRRLHLEIAEALLMQAGAVALERLRQIRRLAVEIHIDDFGAGSSSLSHLQQLPAQTLKIDRSFIHGIASTEGRPELVEGIVALAQSLGIRVAAAGLENVADADRVRKLKCDLGQGFWLSKPLGPETAGKFIGSLSH